MSIEIENWNNKSLDLTARRNIAEILAIEKLTNISIFMDGRYGIRCENLSASEFDDVIEVFRKMGFKLCDMSAINDTLVFVFEEIY